MKRAGFLFAAILALASMPAAADGFETGATYVGSPWTVDGNSEYLVDGAVDIGAVTVAQNVNGSLAIDKSGDFDLSIGALRPVNTYWWYFVDGAIDINVTGGGVKRPAPVEPAGDSFDASAAIHIDASATSTVTLGDIDESSGFRYVESVADVRAGSAMTAEPAPTDSVLIASKPRLKTNALNGMPAFDMGDFAMQSSADRNCACLKYPDVNVREGFLVVRFKSGGSNTAFFLGYIGADYYGFHRGLGDNGTGDSNCQLLTEQYAAAARQGIFCVDGWRVPEWLFRPDDEFHLISFALPSGYPVNTFGGDRNARCGGIELAEAVLFENNLSAAERQAIEARLMEKWFGSGSHSTSAAWNIGKLAFGGDAQPGFDAGATVNVGMLSGEGVFEKEGDGALCASSQSSFSGFDVKGGELSIMRAYPAEVRSAALHFDFSNEDTLTLDNGGVTHVTDVRRSGFYAYVHGQSNGNPVRTALGANGIYGIDFGDYEITSGKSKADTPGASALRIDDGSGGGYVAGVKTAFIVVSGDFENCYEHFLGSTGSWHWNRDCSSFVDDAWSHESLRQATWYIDGEAAASAVSTPIPSGLQVIAMRVAEGGYGGDVNLICADREIRLGGFKYGEVILFTERLGDAQLEAVNEYLCGKWKGSGALVGYDSLSVASGSSFVYGEDLKVNDGATLGFGYPFDGMELDVAGTLVLGSGVTLEVDAASMPLDGEYAIASAQTIEGAENLSTWTLSGNALEGKKASLAVVGGELRLAISATGTIVIIR